MEPEYTAIYRAKDHVDAELACGFLQTQGFRPYCSNGTKQFRHRYFNKYNLQILVPTEEAEAARESMKRCAPDQLIPLKGSLKHHDEAEARSQRVKRPAEHPAPLESNDEQCPKCASNRVTSHRESGYYKFIANVNLICWVGFFGMLAIFHLSNMKLVISWLAGLVILYLYKHRIQRKKTCLNCKHTW